MILADGGEAVDGCWEPYAMRLAMLGTGGYYPSETRHTACMMLPAEGIVLDAGTGMFRLPRYLQTDQLDIFLTHAHLDHVVGLTYLVGILHGRALAGVTIHGQADKLAAIQEHLFSEYIFPVQPTWTFRPLDDETQLPGAGRLTCFPLDHPGGSVGYRLDWPGHSMAYVTDTTAGADCDYQRHIGGVDLLLHECNFTDAQAALAATTGHSCTTPVATLARQAAVGRLVLVHVDPTVEGPDPVGLDAARAIFPATDLAADGMELDF